MVKLAICMPSNRGLHDSKASIESAINYSNERNVAISISDNSGSIEKKNYYSELIIDNIIKYNTPNNNDPTENWLNALNIIDADFKLILSDDDLIKSIDQQSIVYENLADDIIGIRPVMSMHSIDKGIYSTTNFSLTQSNPIDRFKHFLNNNNSATTTYYSFFRSDIIYGILDLVNKHHPTKGEYTDWSIIFALISSGKIINDESSHLIYNNSNWNGDEKYINDKIIDLFTKVDLPPNAIIYLPLLKALDSLILTMRKSSPLPTSERKKSSAYLLLMYVNSFLNSDSSYFKNESSSTIKFIQMLSESKTVNDCIINTIKIISTLRNDLEKKYYNFYYYSIGDEIGSF